VAVLAGLVPGAVVLAVPVLAPLALAVLEVALLTLDIRSCVVASTGFAQTEPEWGVMKWDWITASWKQFPGQVKEKWGKVTGDDLTTIEDYGLPYEAELQERCYAVAPGVNGSSLDWSGVRRINHDKAACNTGPNDTKQARESQTDPSCGLW
jgi:uncharacterized protein YjbJ (UPF0337 family)